MKADAVIARRFLWVGTVAITVGIALSATGVRVAGSIVTLVAAALLVAGLHTFGRAGPDHGDQAEPSSSRPAGREQRRD